MEAVSSFISIAAVLVSFVLQLFDFRPSSIAAAEFTWIDLRGAPQIPLGFTFWIS